MTMLILCCALAGAVLGLRFKVLVLVPAIALAVLTVVVGGVARADGAWAIVGAAAAVATVLQIGYLAGTLTRFAIAGARGARRAPTPALSGRPLQ
jgi:hypothetical protein